MTVYLTNEHSQIYPAVNEQNDPPNVLYNIGIPPGARENILDLPCNILLSYKRKYLLVSNTKLPSRYLKINET